MIHTDVEKFLTLSDLVSSTHRGLVTALPEGARGWLGRWAAATAEGQGGPGACHGTPSLGSPGLPPQSPEGAGDGKREARCTQGRAVGQLRVGASPAAARLVLSWEAGLAPTRSLERPAGALPGPGAFPWGRGRCAFVLSALGPAPDGRLALPPSPASQSLSPHVWLGTTLPRFLPGQPSIRQAAAALWRPRAESAVRSGPYLGCGHDAGEEGSFPQQVPGLTQADRCFRPGPALAGMCLLCARRRRQALRPGHAGGQCLLSERTDT